ncbi:modification methylase HemK [Veillonella montpellierensis DNF00314]|uniref:Release factor glutamine methyltransferase n=1 Tax=Veillonella montpellierensis DNF00314 TaxID=1401067 RepID=A0A096CS15_9FIRM|nr:peptide chain release factor N(5)-glutamine methyltransferase [Veillonella montpellierensis]KGF48139.1 modification methylase HemK [Veillonella montpellierensis DNF00314]
MNKEIWTIGRILQWTEQYFHNKELDTPRLDGEVLLSHVLGKDRIYLYIHYDQPLTTEELSAYKALVLKRVNGYSVASIVGHKEFMGLSFMVNEDVLIPRPDTETLVEYTIESCKQKTDLSVLDVCTGPGTILLSLLHYLPQATGIGLDLSEKALDVAKQNRKALQLEERATLIQSNMFTSLKKEKLFDIIVSNPPYISTGEMDTLPSEVLHEPHMALDGGEDGLDFYRILVSESHYYLQLGGLLIIEIGTHQEEAIIQLFASAPQYKCIDTVRDLANVIRVLVFQKV